MFRIDNATAAAAPPAVPAAGTEGYFTGGDPAIGTPATIVEAWFLNMLQSELEGVVTGAGLTPDKANNGQLYQSIQALVAASAATYGVDNSFILTGSMTVAGGNAYEVATTIAPSVANPNVASGAFTVPVGGDGLWLVQGHGHYNDPQNNGHFILRQNAGIITWSSRPATNLSGLIQTMVSGGALVRLAAGDVLDIAFFSATGQAGLVSQLRFSGVRLGL